MADKRKVSWEFFLGFFLVDAEMTIEQPVAGALCTSTGRITKVDSNGSNVFFSRSDITYSQGTSNDLPKTDRPSISKQEKVFYDDDERTFYVENRNRKISIRLN